MSKHGALRDLAEWLIVWPVLKTLEKLPLPVARAEAEVIATGLRWATPRLAAVARRNLLLALPELSERERGEIVRGVYRTLGRSLLSFARFPTLRSENIGQWIRYEGF